MNWSLREYPSAVINKNNSLQAKKNQVSVRRIFPWTSQISFQVSGVLSVEAAIIIPLFLLAVVSLLEMMDIYRVQSLIKDSLHQSAKELGMYAYEIMDGEGETQIMDAAVCAAYAQKNLPDLGKYIKISMVESCYEENQITLVADIFYRFPIFMVPLPTLHLRNGSSVHSWTGRQGIKNENQTGQERDIMVYVTDYQSVYHTSSNCSHLDLDIHVGKEEQVVNLKNMYGSFYHSCEKCGKINTGDIVYYTERGECFHKQADCSGLVRNIHFIKKSETAGLALCERCEKREGD